MRPGATVVAVCAVCAVLVAAGVLVDRTWLREYNERLRAAYDLDNPARPWWKP